MKLKSLKITSLLLLVLSFNTTYAVEIDEATCSENPNKPGGAWSKFSLTEAKACQDFNDSTTPDDKASKDKRARAKLAENKFIVAKTEGQSYGKWCELPEAKKNEPDGAQPMAPYGSGSLYACDKLAWGNMKTIYSGGGKNNISWETFINHSCKSFCKSVTTGDTHPFENCVEKAKVTARKCESVAFLINSYGRSWSNSEHFEEVSASGSSSAVGAKTTQAANGASASVAIGGNSTIKCVSKGIETLDYDACKKFQVQLDLMDGVQQVGYAAQEMVYKDKMIDSQAKYATEENTATGALKAQGESLKDQQGMYQQRTAVDAVKLGYLYTIYNEFPKTDDIKKKCSSAVSSIKNDFLGALQEQECKDAATPGLGGFALTMNQQQIEAMRSRLIGIATSAGSNLLLANLLGKRADDVNNAIAKIDEFQPVDPFTTTEADAQTTFCRMNPGAAQCLTGDLDRTFDTMNDNVITFGDGATGTSYGTNTSADGTVLSNALADSTARTAVGPVGSVIAAAAQDNSVEKSDAAKVNTSGTGASGGGGSGGGGSAGGGGGGGGAPAGGAAAGQAAAIASRAPNYGGGGGSFSVMGGFGINKKKSEGKAEDNPFGKLFGKDGAAKNGDLNFREIASQKVGGKGDNLFDMISKRYSSVNADKRLLEYELKK